jgi:hypothetical protein
VEAGLGTGSRRHANNGYGSMGTAVVAARAGRQAMRARATRAVRRRTTAARRPRTCGVREATTSISGELYGRPWRQVELGRMGAKTDMGAP